MKVLLHNKELWQKFSEHQTEMMITKSGRRMCPVISLKFEDLNYRQFYTVMVDFVLMDEFRYSFDAKANSWIPCCRERPTEAGCAKVFVHPQTPINGATLMLNGLTFKTLKLTNSFKTAGKSAHAILVSTMRRYTPRIHVLESSNGIYFDYNLRKEFCFPEMEFMAVSQYRNKNITKLKIDANPFASAYRRDGLHGQAKRRRMECLAAGEDERTSDGPPSNSSSIQDSLDSVINGDEPDVDNNSSSTELLDETSPEESFISDEQQVDGINSVSPCQTGFSEVVSESPYVIQAGANNREKLPTVTQVSQSQSTINQTSETEAILTCEESSEWMWGFDEQMSLRYECENSTEERRGDNSGNALQNAENDAKESSTEEAKATVNRRKKYMPRRLQRRNVVSLKTVSLGSKDKEEAKEGEAVNENTVNEMDVLSPQSNNTNGDDSGEPEQACSSDATTLSVSLPRLGVAEKTPVTCSNSVLSETVNSYTDALLPSRFKTETGVLFVIGQNGSRAPNNVTGEPLAAFTSSSSGTENITGSSLNALIEMCSKAGGSLNNPSYLPWSAWGTVTRDISPRQMEGAQASQDISSGELRETVNEETVSTDSSKETGVPVTNGGADCFLNEETEEESTTSSNCQLSQVSACSSSVSLVSQSDVQESLRLSVIPMSSQYNGHATTSEATVTASAGNTSSGCSFTSDTVDKSPTATDLCPTGSTVVTISCVETPFPVIVETFSGHHVLNGFNSGQQLDNTQKRYRPIVPAPSKSVNTSFDAPTNDAFVNSSGCNNDILYPVINDCFSLANDDQYAVAEKQPPSSNSYFIPHQNSPQPQVNTVYFPSPNAQLTGHSGFTVMDNTSPMQALRLEKFYSFSTLGEQVKSPVRPQTRHYKTTRTNFSRLSLEPICSVIYPLSSSTCQSTSENSATREVLTQRAWGWRLR